MWSIRTYFDYVLVSPTVGSPLECMGLSNRRMVELGGRDAG